MGLRDYLKQVRLDRESVEMRTEQAVVRLSERDNRVMRAAERANIAAARLLEEHDGLTRLRR